jgi:hypothetical protein
MEELQELMNETAARNRICNLQIGTICSVKYLGKWYRCLVEELYANAKYLIFVVDIGTRESINAINIY